MGCFISYSRPDVTSVRALSQDLESSGHQVWLDQELGGGVKWWQTILQQIRTSDVFIFAVSEHWRRSKPCQQEFLYATALGIPLLPVQVGPVDNLRTLSFGQLQLIDYQSGSKSAFIGLLNAVQQLTRSGWARPATLPPEPPIPYEYLMRLGDRVAAQSLSSAEQLELLDQIRRALEEETDERARDDLRGLLVRLRQRSDVTYRTATEVDAVLAQQRTGAPTFTPTPPNRPAQPPPGSYQGAPQPTGFYQAAPPPTQQPTPPYVQPTATGSKPPVLSVIAFVLGFIGIFFVPILFGGAAIVCAVFGLVRKERPAKPALAFAIVATVAGLIFGAFIGAMSSF